MAPVRVDPRGVDGPTKRQAAGPDWRRTSRGFYVPAHVDRTGLQRTVEAGVLVPRYSAVTGWAALGWRGGRWFDGTARDGSSRPVDIAAPRHRIRGQDGIHVTEERFRHWDSTVVDGVVVANPQRALCFELRYAWFLRAAVRALDMAAFDDLVSLEESQDYTDRHPSYTGIQQARDADALGDENVWSPREVDMRLCWVLDARLPQPLTNRPVFDLHGRHLGTPDLIDPEAGVAAEYDGRLHLVPAQRGRDVERDARYRGAGLELVIMTAVDLRDTGPFEQRLRAAYAAAAARPASDRHWTTELPSWWVPTFTVADRRALDSAQQARFLRYRAS